MPSEKHTKAERIIKDMIIKEFGNKIESISEDSMYYGIRQWRPDLTFQIKNYGRIVIEIGYISEPEKIVDYMQDNHIVEFRWYTKEPKIILTIDKGNPYKWIEVIARTKIGKPWMKRQIEGLLSDIKEERSDFKKEHRILQDNVYAVCPSCHGRFKVNEGKIINYNASGSYQIIVCSKCDSVPSREEFDNIAFIQKELRVN